MASFDAYGRPVQGEGGDNYYETYEPYDTYDSNKHIPAYSNSSTRYSTEPRDTAYSSSSQSASSVPPPPPPPQQTYPSSNNMGMPYGADRASAGDHDAVSPEIIAAITEKVKRELFEHLKQTGNIDDQLRASSMQQSEKSSSTNPSPPPSGTRRVYTPPSPTSTTKPSFSPPPTEFMRSPPASPREEKPAARFSEYSRSTRQPTLNRSFSTLELSTIDQKWGRLFDSEGLPTERLGQFLRGLANHIVDDFTPKKSIVITPSKMAAYYGAYPIDKEIYNYISIFKSTSNPQISKLYQDLGCQHHLVQANNNSAPSIPALTPLGFAHWMTMQITAYPDEESQRLEKVVLALPINADGPPVDGKPERLPKQISRHLLPNSEDRESQKLLKAAVNRFYDESGISPGRSKPTASSPPLRPTSPTPTQSRPVDIPEQRASVPASNPIERERQPYVAQPGSGKKYAEPSNLNIPNRPGRANSTSRKDVPERSRSRESRHTRTQSTASQESYRPPPPASSKRRDRSPQLRGFSQSTPNDINTGSSYAPSSSFPPAFAPSSYGSTNSFPPPPASAVETSRDARDRRREERLPHRRGTEDERYTATSDFTSPRDAERWDRMHDTRSTLSDYDVRDGKSSTSYETRSTFVEPNDVYEDWYRGSGVSDKTSNRHSSYDRYTPPNY